MASVLPKTGSTGSRHLFSVGSGIVIGSQEWPVAWTLINEGGRLIVNSTGPDSLALARLGFAPDIAALHSTPLVQFGHYFLQGVVDLKRQTRLLVIYDSLGHFLRARRMPDDLTIVDAVPGNEQLLAIRRLPRTTVIALSLSGIRH